jgi:hypothetical protein
MTDEMQQTDVPQESTFEIPEKFRDKEFPDVVKSYVELEKALGKQSKEIGELRKLADDLIVRQMEEQLQPKEEPVDFQTDPEKFVQQTIATNPKLRELEQATAVIKKNETLSQLTKKYGNLEPILADEDFQEWVQKSKIRTDLYLRANNRYDFDAADELLDTWTERKKIKKTQEVEEQQEEELKSGIAAAGSSKGNSGSADFGSGKIYRRADILRLNITDPNRYKQLLPEIRKAYSEGRVK